MSDADGEAIVRILLDHDVDFVVIGASAAILQGVPIAATLDLDVTAATSTANLKRLAAALKEMDARLRVPDPEESVAVVLDARTLAGLSVATLVTRHGPFNLLFAPAGSSSYAELKGRSVEVDPFRMPFRVASIEDLISMKRATGREKDAAHLTILLEHVRSEEGKG